MRHIKREMIDYYNIPFREINNIKSGADFVTSKGEIVSNERLTTPPTPSRSYAYCSDTVRHPIYLNSIEGADLLYHESTFLHEMVDRAKETFHTTSLEAAEIAKEAHVKKLLLGHYSARYRTLQPLLEEAQQVFPTTELSVEGKWFLV